MEIDLKEIGYREELMVMLLIYKIINQMEALKILILDYGSMEKNKGKAQRYGKMALSLMGYIKMIKNMDQELFI